MKKNYVLAFALSFGVLMLWQYFVGKSQKPAEMANGAAPVAPVAFSTALPTKTPASTVPIQRESAVVFTLGNNRVSLNRFGGGVTQWEIKEGEKWLSLTPEKQFSIEPLSTFPDVSYDMRREGDEILLTARRDDGLMIEKRIRVSPYTFLHRVSVRLTNTGSAPLSPAYEIGWGPGVEASDESGKDGREAKGFQRALVFEGSKLTKLKPGTHTGTFDWWGVDGHYFLAAFVRSPGKSASAGTLLVEKEDHYFSVRRVVSFQLNPGESREEGDSFYLGPKGYLDLKSLELGLEQSVDFGYFAPFGRVIHRALFTFHKVTRNYGWAIILLTVIIQILVLPLTIKSFQHGQKMKTIQPQMKRLQELHKNDARRLNSEMLALYQRHGLRFMGMEGCVPMLIQLPVFWALFSTLRNTFELRHAPWFGWVKDLSAHDPYFVLPILMGGGMFVQQKMTMSSMDPSQKQIMYMMPIIFTFIFLKMPSGLVIYWLTNSLLTIAVQYYLMRRASSVEIVK
ncbi:MAG: membrane protein insertase YidC [Elusimicrobia bacterium]|nr:membrane protein insertase YidC [Elusimicrobiota bacterium]